MKQVLSMALGMVLALVLALTLWGCTPRHTASQGFTSYTNTTNSAPCYSGLCNSSCPNRSHGTPCGVGGNGSQCYSGSPCRGIILDK